MKSRIYVGTTGRFSPGTVRYPFRVVWLGVVVAGLISASCSKSSAPAESASKPGERVKLGFLVKQPDEPWFQLEWKFADQAGRDLGAEIIKIGAVDAEKALSAIDTLVSAGAKGFVICTPDTRIGPAIVAKAKASGLKVIAVDDQFMGNDGPLKDVPYVGVSATKIGTLAGEALVAEMKRRNWPLEGTGLAVMSYDQLETARLRTTSATEAVVAGGLPRAQVYKANLNTPDMPGAFDAANVLLAQHAGVKRWLVCGSNDNFVLGAVRALEGRGFTAETAIGVGINGTDCIVEFEKPAATAFFGSILLAPKQHGYETVAMLHRWVTKGEMPPLDTRTAGRLITKESFARVLQEEGIR